VVQGDEFAVATNPQPVKTGDKRVFLSKRRHSDFCVELNSAKKWIFACNL